MSNENETAINKARAFLEQEHVPMDFSEARHYLCCRLTGYKYESGVRLGATMHIRYLDLALVPYLETFDQDGGVWIPELPKEADEIWQVTKDEIVRSALANTQKTYPPRMQALGDLMAFGNDPYDYKAGLYVLTAGDPLSRYAAGNCFGAIALAIPGVLEKAARRFQSDFYVLPRAMSDVLLIPIQDGKDYNPRCLRQILASSNAVLNADSTPVLSDSIYRYICGDGLMIV